MKSNHPVFFDTVYSPDDKGYYCQVYLRNGTDYGETSLYPTKEQAEKEVESRYANATKIKDIN